MRKPILKVLMTYDVDHPQVDGHKMITCSEVILEGETYTQYEYIPEDIDLCSGGNAERVGDEIVTFDKEASNVDSDGSIIPET